MHENSERNGTTIASALLPVPLTIFRSNSKLKIANVIPLHKSDDPMTFDNHRPVSVLRVLSKAFDKNV